MDNGNDKDNDKDDNEDNVKDSDNDSAQAGGVDAGRQHMQRQTISSEVAGSIMAVYWWSEWGGRKRNLEAWPVGFSALHAGNEELLKQT